MTPREITSELDKHIIGQDKAKRAVAIALRNRWRRMKLDDAMRSEITPKNIFVQWNIYFRTWPFLGKFNWFTILF